MNLAHCETHRDEKGSLNLKMKCLTWKICRSTKHEIIWLLSTRLLWFAMLLSSATLATATISVTVSDHDLIRQSVAIVVGQVKTIESFSDLQEGLIFTCITLTIDEVLKGDVSITELTIKQPGGAVGDTTTWIFGSPEFTTGEQVLLFLTSNADGTLRVAHFYQGKFSIVSDQITGKKMVNRNDNPVQVLMLDGIDKVEAAGASLTKLRELESFKARVRAMVKEESQRPQVRSTPSILFTKPSVTGVSELLPEFHTPNMSRWFEPDDGVPVTMRINAQGEPDAPGHGFDQILAALQAWSGVEGSSFHYQDGGLTDSEGFQEDGVSAISFGDPLGQMDPPTDCAGLLAIAGFMQDVTETRIVNGQSFFRIVEGDVVFNSGWNGCGFLEDFNNFAEVAAHELGHVLGLAHSTDPEAIMYPYAHLDGRGASLGKDDIDGLVFLYPATVTPLGVATLLSPSGITDPTPTFTWSAVAGATSYYLWVNDGAGNQFKRWYRSSDAQVGDGGANCSVTPDIELAAGRGRWWVRAWNVDGYGPWSDPLVFMVERKPIRMNVRPTIVSSAGQLEANWDGIVAPTATDWLGLYEPGAADTEYLTWCYTGGKASGRIPFELPSWLGPGIYELRLFANNGYHRLAISNTFSVDWEPVRMSVSPTIVSSAGQLEASWDGIVAPTATDWLSLYEPGAADTEYLTWCYTGGEASGRIPFELPSWLSPGIYELRLFANNGYHRLAISNTFSVDWEPVRMSVSPTIVSSAGQLEASWDGIVAPTATDWLGLYEPGAADTEYLTWCYTGGEASGRIPFELPSWLSPGIYELRLFANNGYHRLAISNTFKKIKIRPY